MKHERGQVMVTFDLDPIPGAAHTIEDWQVYLQRLLDDMVGHYKPIVTIFSGSRFPKPMRPCNIVPEDQLWCVAGIETGDTEQVSEMGVLVWCPDQADAEKLVSQMSGFPFQFSHLRACKWTDYLTKEEL